jgi:hypothetical protein
MSRSCTCLVYAIIALVAQGCAGGASSMPSTTAMPAASARPLDLAALPLDDANTSSTPKAGYVYSCQSTFGGGGASADGPWINEAAGTFDLETKLAVEGAVTWNAIFGTAVSGSLRSLTGNGLPSHTTGTFPIASMDPAYQYDRNPNAIAAQNVAYRVPSTPGVASSPSCLNMGPIGVMLTGAQLYSALDAEGRDAVAHEVLDSCTGHPDQSGTYHYHDMSACISDPGMGHSALIGYALDGFGIYGMRGENGETLTDADLDACHGHTHAIMWNGVSVVMYHYHMTHEYPYSLGCYAGTPVATGP